MPVDFERLRIFVGQDAQLGILLNRAHQVDKIAVGAFHPRRERSHLRRQRRIRQPRADRFRHVQRGRTLGYFLRASIG